MTVASLLTPPPELPQPWRQTPLVESAALSRMAGCRIFLKLDNLQPSGSFKSRGIGNLVRQSISSYPPDTPLHFYASSGGNAGLACVTAASALYGYPSTVVVPVSTSPEMVKNIVQAGAGAATVIVQGKTIAEADNWLRETLLPQDPYGIYVPPFDHPDIWKGASSVAHELVDQLLGVPPDAIVCSVGGGGLLIGICQGLEECGVTVGCQTRVVGVETQGAESFAEALRAGHVVTLPGIKSIATSLGCVRVAQKALQVAERGNVTSVVVTDRQAVDACLRFADDERILVEPACGATLAMIYSGKLREVMGVTEQSIVVLEVCGGSNVSLQLLDKWKVEYGL
ncbi:uncharacterized protein L203_104434 [Cryptococcus depauperatus CBS 7841]|uniref:L-serine ammonia-lyase n=1 Tax=Cryptococcus depauperatus CBS 7841 TaxID=1295531 RepID=A0A1E3IG71_9TREE|nr:hypothetical protein L203_03372 [Cryptococcus depauperatus CBS 7841]